VSSTSRVLREDELSAVTPVWWRGNEGASAPKGKTPRITRPTPPGAATSDIERERLEREAYERGLAEGKALGKEQVAAEIAPVMDRLGRSLASLASLRIRMRKDGEKELLALAVAVARRVMHRELTLDPESIGGLIKVALEKLQARELCRVRVNPAQEDAVRASLERLASSQKLEVLTDSSLQIGDLLFETAHGTLDASIEAQLREIERGFADRLQR
jgi:flagellar assembly protein FliH